MGWIKRNLFFVIGGAVALVLLGAGGFYTYRAWSRNAQATKKLNEMYGTLQSLQMQHPAPGNAKINNTAIAEQQQKEVEKWIKLARGYFANVPTIPPGKVTSEGFASALRRTINVLDREAKNASVTLPPKYDFSFTAQRPLVKFAPGSLNPLATQLGDIKAIAEVIFSAKVNALDAIQRVRVSTDDMNGPQGDYINQQPVTNDLAVITPYVVTFRGFTPELAHVISAFATSSNAFLIKAINVMPASAAQANSTPDQATPGYPGRYPGMPGYPEGVGVPLGRNPAVQPGVRSTVSRDGLQTVLKEQLLQVTMEVDIVKLLPKS